jgi:hypothetical protein
MFDKIPMPTAGVLIIAAVAVVCACQFEDVPPPVQPETSQSASPKASSFVGTPPIPLVDERATTPTESVGAASNE